LSGRAEPGFDPSLEALFRPRGIAYVGLPRRGRSLGGLALSFGIARPGQAKVFAVHPELADVQGVSANRSLSDIQDPVDVAFLSVPAHAVAGVIDECGARGVRFAIVGSSGFSEAGESGAAEQERVLAAARAGGVRLVGPNCNGIWNARDGLSIGFNTSHGHNLRAGGISVVGQTGAVLGSFLAGVHRVGGGISCAISTGNEADLDAAECFLYLSQEPTTQVIVLLLDSITRPEVFEEAARSARAREIPVVVFKFGKSAQGRHAAELHSSRVAGGARAFSAWLRALGVVEAPDLEGAMFAAAMLGSGHRGGEGIGAISTSGAGAAVMADLAESWGATLPAFDALTRKRLAELFDFSEPFNPLDLAGQANDATWLEETFDACFQDPGFDTVVLMSTLLPPKERGVVPVVAEFAAATARHAKAACVYALGPLADEHRDDLTAAGIPIADSGAALMGGLDTLRRLEELRRSPLVEPSGPDTGARLSWPSVEPGALVLHDEARSKLEYLGVPFIGEASAHSPEQVAGLLESLGGGPVALKLLDRGLSHKAAAGGVVLGVSDPTVATNTAEQLFGLSQSPDARVLLQVMSDFVVEIFVGTVCDPVTGPVVVVGRGGSDVERDPEVRVEMAPYDQERAAHALRGIRPVADGLRTAARQSGRDFEDCLADVAAVVATVSRIAYDNRDSISSIDLNPLVVRADGRPVALDARIQLAPEQTASQTPERGLK